MSLWCNVCGSSWLILCMISCLVSWFHALIQSCLWMTDLSFPGFDDIMPCFLMSHDVMSHYVMFHEVSWCHVSWCFMISPIFHIWYIFHFVFSRAPIDVLLIVSQDICVWQFPSKCDGLDSYFKLQIVHMIMDLIWLMVWTDHFNWQYDK